MYASYGTGEAPSSVYAFCEMIGRMAPSRALLCALCGLASGHGGGGSLRKSLYASSQQKGRCREVPGAPRFGKFSET